MDTSFKFRNFFSSLNDTNYRNFSVGDNGVLLTTILLNSTIFEEHLEERPTMIYTFLSPTLTTLTASILLVTNGTILLALTDQILPPTNVFQNHPFFISSYLTEVDESSLLKILRRHQEHYDILVFNLTSDSPRSSNSYDNQYSDLASFQRLKEEKFCIQYIETNVSDEKDLERSLDKFSINAFIVLYGSQRDIDKFRKLSSRYDESFFGQNVIFYPNVCNQFTKETHLCYKMPGEDNMEDIAFFTLLDLQFVLFHHILLLTEDLENEIGDLVYDSLKRNQNVMFNSSGEKMNMSQPLKQIWEELDEDSKLIIISEIGYKRRVLLLIFELLKSQYRPENIMPQGHRNSGAPNKRCSHAESCPDETVRRYSLSTSPFCESCYRWNCQSCDRQSKFINSTTCQKCPLNYIVLDSNPRECIPGFILSSLSFMEVRGMIVTVLSIVMILMIIICFVCFYKYKNTPVVRSTDAKLSLIQLFAHLIGVISLWFTFFWSPHSIKCTIRPFCYGLPFTLVMAIHICKAQTKVTIFQSSVKMSRSEILKVKAVELFIIIFLLTINVLLISITSEITSRNSMLDGHVHGKIFEVHCTNDIEILIQLGWICLLVFVIICQGIRSRKLPQLYQESTMVVYSSMLVILTIICTVIIYLSVSSKLLKSYFLYLSGFVMNFTHFILLFSKRIYLLLFRADKNAIAAITKERFKQTKIDEIELPSKAS